MALEGEYCDTTTLLDNYSDLLSIGTIGDVVELKDENRVFVKHGLESIATIPIISKEYSILNIRTNTLTVLMNLFKESPG